ncbi:aminomethyl-transferring glycine dehydrogenase subunit GcvPB [candidate division WOR-3 bacterium]|uniref:Probable glycine dehydrogenase (decarboxylating) subunit 2 n=1 Tax=candidate division WOR-3 bacterium TaxID=2052148 RepID=A0A660SGD2_UNCW3|nr:MAG: aminomethyl-transferring glycine dehydrogenase subunit GcvPB [candidate division WOR-3 bacterium]
MTDRSSDSSRPESRLIFEKSRPGRKGYSLPRLDVPPVDPLQTLPKDLVRTDPPELPELSEPEVVRHFVNLSVKNHHVDRGFYPLGSCTMKYNPKIGEELARLPGFTQLHPFQPEQTVQGALQLMWELGQLLLEIVGLDAITLQPAAGAHGEFTGISIIRAYHESQGRKRRKILIPDSAHGTNPASTTLSGYLSVKVPSNRSGTIDLYRLKDLVDDDVAGIMITNPNTLGIFEKEIDQVIEIIHDKGGLVYLDGANLNALIGISRPGDCGFDIVHFNLHKTFSTPHGGGGPGSGPIAVTERLARFLPVPVIEKGDGYHLNYDRSDSIGKVHSFYGNFLVMVKAYAYLRMLGPEGLYDVAKASILNANYLIQSLKDDYKLPYPCFCMHEGVLSGSGLKAFGVRTLDVAKRLLDFGFHAPTIYFPLIVSEALMIEPTETESIETLEDFITAMKRIRKEAETDPERLKKAPTQTPVRRLDEVKAARELNVRYQG